jgi:hypothetical protein
LEEQGVIFENRLNSSGVIFKNILPHPNLSIFYLSNFSDPDPDPYPDPGLSQSSDPGAE